MEEVPQEKGQEEKGQSAPKYKKEIQKEIQLAAAETLGETEDNEDSADPNENAKSSKAPIQKHKKFKLSPLLKFLVLATVIVTGIFAYLLYKYPPQIIKKKEEEPPVVVTRPEPENPRKTYSNDIYKFQVEYNTDKHEFKQTAAETGQLTQIWIVGKETQPEEIKEETELTTGYLVKISVFEGIDRDVKDLAQRKREKYALECPTVAEVSRVATRSIDGQEAKGFEVINCPQNYVETFARYKGNIIEITQVYRGDLGFKQSYRAQTEAIVRSFGWIRDPYEEPNIEIVENEDYRIRLIHPRLDTSCCSVTVPSLEGLEKIVVLADPGNKDKEGNVRDRFGVFAVSKKGKTFELFLNEQKQALIQEFRVVEERNPTDLAEEKILIDGNDAFKLKNYAWWGEVIYMESPVTEHFLVFVIPNSAGESFRNTIDEILNSVEFFGPEE